MTFTFGNLNSPLHILGCKSCTIVAVKCKCGRSVRKYLNGSVAVGLAVVGLLQRKQDNVCKVCIDDLIKLKIMIRVFILSMGLLKRRLIMNLCMQRFPSTSPK